MGFSSPPYDALKCAFHCHFSWHNQLGLRRPSGLATLRAFHDGGFGAVGMTEHAYESNLSVEAETRQAWQDMPGHDETVPVVGLETSFAADPEARFGRGDCVALFLSEYVDCLDAPGNKARPLEWVLDRIHEQDGLAIVAHPHHCTLADGHADGIWAGRKGFSIDGWEVFHGCSLYTGDDLDRARFRAEDAIEEGYIALASPDSHTPFQATCSEAACTYVFVTERSADGVKDGLRARRTVAFANGVLYGGPEWVQRFKEWRLSHTASHRGLWCSSLFDASGNAQGSVSALRSLADRYAGARPSAEEYRRELMGLSDLTWQIDHSDGTMRELVKTAAALSRRVFRNDEEDMLNWYRDSRDRAMQDIAADPDNPEAHDRAGEAGAFFPEVLGGFEESRQHLERALEIDPSLHIARAALVNLLRKRFHDEALAHCEAGLALTDATPYLAALQRYLKRL